MSYAPGLAPSISRGMLADSVVNQRNGTLFEPNTLG